MKNLNHFEAFKLNKKQMNAIAGGTLYHCVVFYADEYGGTYVRTIESDATLEEVEDAVSEQAPDAIVTCM
ncbi:hypothetical protein EV202_1399 [Bacteroides heparinolyticus]|uniref:Uncharacterized protein n=1 Tax=Prevotella heparinolytica TaxID=28113 RepID=A0A4R2LE19_9BACE|nr:hypothetical protein [Bacteroides heparinolyticus]TCO86878.1 hypothetical protein EV202_1399 [Bacteroides heparinolyticus]